MSDARDELIAYLNRVMTGEAAWADWKLRSMVTAVEQSATARARAEALQQENQMLKAQIDDQAALARAEGDRVAARCEELERALQEIVDIYDDNDLDARHHGFDSAIEDGRAALGLSK